MKLKATNKAPHGEKRKMAYPDIGEQLDKLWHDLDRGCLDITGEFFTALKAVKEKYPKDH
jgi:hypothetical protein